MPKPRLQEGQLRNKLLVIKLTINEVNFLKNVAAEMNMPVSTLFRKSVNEYVKNNRKRKSGWEDFFVT